MLRPMLHPCNHAETPSVRYHTDGTKSPLCQSALLRMWTWRQSAECKIPSHSASCCRSCGLDVYEDEPNLTPGLDHCENVVIVPHIASASLWTRSGMVTASLLLSACLLVYVCHLYAKASFCYERVSILLM